MEKQPFTFGNYLHQLAAKATGEGSDIVLIEVESLKTHCADLRTMQRHLKQYKTLKALVDSGINIFSPLKHL